jgi:hypothetical protein
MPRDRRHAGGLFLLTPIPPIMPRPSYHRAQPAQALPAGDACARAGVAHDPLPAHAAIRHILLARLS